MNYKTILNNRFLILIDKLFRLIGFYIELTVEDNKLVDVKFRKLYK